MGEWLLSATIGVAAGVLSGMFGVGGGILTTPAIRLLAGAPPLIAVGTPLPVIIPGALAGAISHARRGSADVRAGIIAGAAGALTAVLGALLTRLAGGTAVLLGTAALVAWAAVDMAAQAFRRPPVPASTPAPEAASGGVAEVPSDLQGAPGDTTRRPATLRLVVIGLVAGAYSGFLGLGGGFVLVPMLSRWLRFPVKRAIGTSLVAVTILAVPGTLTHAAIGNVDWSIAGGLVCGVVPGAIIGARLSARAQDRTLSLGFACILIVSALWLAVNEIASVR